MRDPTKYLLEIGDDDLDDVFFTFGGKEGEVSREGGILGLVGGFSFEVVDGAGFEAGNDGDMVGGVVS